MINAVDGMMRKRAPGSQNDNQHLEPEGPIVDDPVAERRKHLALQVRDREEERE